MRQPLLPLVRDPSGGASKFPVYLLATLLATSCCYTPLHAMPTIPKQDTTDSQLYSLLVAEIAASRNLRKIAIKNYLKVANESNDPAIAEEATILAINFEATEEAIQAAKRWASLDPQNLQAQLVTMTLLIGASIDEAIPYLKQALAINPNNIDQEILEIQLRLSKSSARSLQRTLFNMAETESNNPYILLTAAQSAAQQKDPKNAKKFVEKALKVKPDLTRAIQLKSRIIHYEHSATQALQFLKKNVEQNPENIELTFFYAEALYEDDQKETAKKTLLPLVNDKVFGGPTLILIAEIYTNNKEWDAAKKMLNKAILLKPVKTAAEYLLGEIAEQQEDIRTAIQWYSNISEGPYHIPAMLRAVSLLKKDKAYDEAIEILQNTNPTSVEEQKYLLLTEVDLLNMSQKHEQAFELIDHIMSKIPNDLDVLFTYATTANKLKKWDISENILKQILKENPNHASALNALGYRLSFDENRIKESLEYIHLALSISPNNPEFMDSLGWVHYQLGNMKEAIHYLRQANDLTDDSEIAAHFAEALWKEHKEEALKVLAKALKIDENNTTLRNTLKRLNIELPL